MNTERASELIYEAVTGKCWHKETSSTYNPYGGHVFAKCSCGHKWNAKRNPNPPLSTSLDAWREIWDAMDKKQKHEHWTWLCEVTRGEDYPPTPLDREFYIWMSTPLHHLEAAMRSLTVECDKCEDGVILGGDGKTIMDESQNKPCTCKSGRITLWELEGEDGIS